MTATLIKEASGEVVTGKDGRWKIKVIQAGEGSSGFYPREVLERDGALAFPKGTKIYANHPTMDEEWNRPERDVNHIVGYTLEDATYEDGALYAPVQFIESFAPVIAQLKEVLGMSIYAFADSEVDTIGDYTGSIITKFPPAGHPNLNSIDVVTAAGAGGAILERITESFKRKSESQAPTVTPAEDTERGNQVSAELDAIKALADQVTAFLATQNQEVQAEVDAEALKTASDEGVSAYDEKLVLIEAATKDLLPSQVKALRESAKRGEDITDALEANKTIAKEALEAAGGQRQRESKRESGDRYVETGRVGESYTNDEDFEPKSEGTRGLFD